MAEGDTIADREEFYTGDDCVRFFSNKVEANVFLPDTFDVVGQFGHSAMIGLYRFI